MTRVSEDNFEKCISDFYSKLLNEQEDLGPEFRKVLEDNYWELLEGSNND